MPRLDWNVPYLTHVFPTLFSVSHTTSLLILTLRSPESLSRQRYSRIILEQKNNSITIKYLVTQSSYEDCIDGGIFWIILVNSMLLCWTPGRRTMYRIPSNKNYLGGVIHYRYLLLIYSLALPPSSLPYITELWRLSVGSLYLVVLHQSTLQFKLIYLTEKVHNYV